MSSITYCEMESSPPPPQQREGKALLRAESSLKRLAVMGSIMLAILFTLLPSSWLSTIQNHHNGVGDEAYCSAWRLSVEVNNMQKWRSVPSQCVPYVGKYMESEQYHQDMSVAIDQARNYASDIHKSKEISNGDAWIFDVDETTLSNLPYYRTIQYGPSGPYILALRSQISRDQTSDLSYLRGLPYNHTKYFAWVTQGKASAINETLAFYNELKEMEFSIFFLTGRRYMYRNVTEENLIYAGYSNWKGVLMREANDTPGRVQDLKIFKRAQLVKQGYKIWGNMGDQWSDLTGEPTGSRIFKLPNPMYYVG